MSSRARFRERLERARNVHVDARVIAFHLLGGSGYSELTRLLLSGVRAGKVSAQTSSLSIYQLLCRPYRIGTADAAERTARQLSAFPGLRLEPVSDSIARQAAEVHARLGGRLERAVQVATALAGEADLFLTEGSGLRRIAGMGIVDLDDFVA